MSEETSCTLWGMSEQKFSNAIKSCTREDLEALLTEIYGNLVCRDGEFAESESMAADSAADFVEACNFGFQRLQPNKVPYVVTVSAVSIEDPLDNNVAMLSVFKRHHARFKDPADLGFYGYDESGSLHISKALRSLLDRNLAFFCRYSEHGNCIWSLSSTTSRGSSYDFDTVAHAGILQLHPENSESMSLEERKNLAEGLLEQYTDYCNGVQEYTFSIMNGSDGDEVSHDNEGAWFRYDELSDEITESLPQDCRERGVELECPSHTRQELKRELQSRLGECVVSLKTRFE